MFDQDVFSDLRKLIKLLEKHDLTEIEIEQKDATIRVRRAGAQPVVALQGPAVAAPTAGTAPSGPAAAAPAGKASDGDGMRVVSPFVGTFYRSPAPSEPSFCKVGDTVKKGQTLCIVEAMKLMNEIESPVSGKIEAILVENESTIEYGQELFIISPA